MSTPIRHAKHIDPALMYAPPRVRERDLVPTEPSALAAVNSDRGSAPRESRGDRAITKVQRRLALNPEWVPEPPQSQPDGRSYWTIGLPAVGILGLAAVIVWVVVSIPSARLLLKSDLVRAGFLGTSVATDLAEQFPRTRLSDRQTGVSAKAAQESGNLQEPRSRSDPSEFTAVAPAPSVPVAPTRAPPSIPPSLDAGLLVSAFDSSGFISQGERRRPP
jgi:cytoskeletal protein RodZ